MAMNLRSKRQSQNGIGISPSLAVVELTNMSTEQLRRKNFLACKQKKVIKEEAFQELLMLRARNGGKAKYGDIPSIVSKYHALGYDYVTRGVLCYMISDRENIPLDTIEINNRETVSDASNVSSLTIMGESMVSNTDGYRNSYYPELPEMDSTENGLRAVSSGIGGRPKGTTDISKIQEMIRTKEALTEASILLRAEQEKARLKGLKKVGNGTLKTIISNMESHHSLSDRSLSSFTVINRVRKMILPFARRRKRFEINGNDGVEDFSKTPQILVHTLAKLILQLIQADLTH
jgi:hypothetical protein